MSRLKDLILEIQEDIEVAKGSGFKLTRDGVIDAVAVAKPSVGKLFIGDVYDLMYKGDNNAEV
jgi:ribosome-interacting GTPase 1